MYTNAKALHLSRFLNTGSLTVSGVKNL